MYRVVYSGFDTLDVSFKGALPIETLETLENAQKEAKTGKRDISIKTGPGKVPMLLKPHGMSGGYAFVLTNGPTGGIFTFVNNADLREWNIAVSVRALRLLTHGYRNTKVWIFSTLEAMGCRIVDHSVRRIDFAVDIVAPGFHLDLNSFVAHARTKSRPYWSDRFGDSVTEALARVG